MAGRGVKKDYRVNVTSARQWEELLNFDGLLVVEVYSSWFGPCQVMTSTIQQIMLMYSDSEARIKWPVINVAQLEKERKEQVEEKEQKIQEMAVVQRRRSVAGGEPGTKEEDHGTTGAEEEEDNESKLKGTWDKTTIEKLEAYSGYDNPRPLWVFMKNKEIHYELRTANPPKMMKLISSLLTNQQLDEKELSAMDASGGARNRKKLMTSEAKTRQLLSRQMVEEEEEGMSARREPKVVLSVSLSDLARGPATGITGQHPLVAVFEKNTITEAFTYVGKTERVLNDPNPMFNKTFWLDKPRGDKEYKLAVYDVVDDKARVLNPSDLIGECTINLSLQKASPKQFKLTDKNGDEIPKTILWVSAKEPTQNGKVSRYAMIINCKGLPEGVNQTIMMLQVKDSNIPKFGAVSQSEPLVPMSEGSALAAALSLSPGPSAMMTTPVMPARGRGHGHRQSISAIPGARFVVDQYSLNDRQLRFVMYDSTKFDAAMAWANADNDKAIVGYTTASLGRIHETTQLSQDGTIVLPVCDSMGKQLGKAELVIKMQEIAIPKEKRGAADDGKPKIEISLTVRELARRNPDSKGHIQAALFRRNADGKYDYLGHTEELKDVEANMHFWKTFIIDKPVGESEYKLSILDVEDNKQDDPVAAAAIAAAIQATGPIGELLAETTFDAYSLMDFRTHELKVLDEDGMQLDRCAVYLNAREIGLVKRSELAVSCSNITGIGRPVPNPVVALFAANFSTGQWSRGRITHTEHQYVTANPAFNTGLRTEVYTQADRELYFVVYDADEQGHLKQDRIIGEVGCSLNEFLGHRAPQLEYILTKHGSDGEVPASADGSAKLRVWAHKPAPVIGEYYDPADDQADFVDQRERADPIALEKPSANDDDKKETKSAEQQQPQESARKGQSNAGETKEAKGGDVKQGGQSDKGQDTASEEKKKQLQQQQKSDAGTEEVKTEIKITEPTPVKTAEAPKADRPPSAKGQGQGQAATSAAATQPPQAERQKSAEKSAAEPAATTATTTATATAPQVERQKSAEKPSTPAEAPKTDRKRSAEPAAVQGQPAAPMERQQSAAKITTQPAQPAAQPAAQMERQQSASKIEAQPQQPAAQMDRQQSASKIQAQPQPAAAPAGQMERQQSASKIGTEAPKKA